MKIRPCSLDGGFSLAEAKALGRNFADERVLPERTSSIPLGSAGPLRNLRTDFLFDYDVFPRTIMRFDAEWVRERRKMAVGDIIIQRAVLPPVGFGLCLEFAVRICAIFDEERRVGFAYETLTGHAESGVSEFYFDERQGDVLFTIRTFSQPGHWTSRFASRFIALPYQAWCTQRALRHVRGRFHLENPND